MISKQKPSDVKLKQELLASKKIGGGNKTSERNSMFSLQTKRVGQDHTDSLFAIKLKYFKKCCAKISSAI